MSASLNSEPPIFGENGAVLNSHTMMDEWRVEHQKNMSLAVRDSLTQSWPNIIRFGGAWAALQFVKHNLPIDTPLWVGLLAAVGAVALAFAIYAAMAHSTSRLKNFLFPSARELR